MEAAGKTRAIGHDIFVVRCVACGYDGALLKAGRAERCARCGCDLLERPARSYAEMEGLLDEADSADARPRAALQEVDAVRPPYQTIQRWLAFMFFVMIGLILFITLVAAALP